MRQVTPPHPPTSRRWLILVWALGLLWIVPRFVDVPHVNAQSKAERTSFAGTYRRERAELLATRATLVRTLQGIRNNSKEQRKALLRKVQRLNQKIQYLRKQVDRWDEKVSQLQRLKQANKDNEQTFQATLKLALSELKNYGLVTQEQASEMASLRSIVAQSHKLIRRFARVNRRKGTFYDRSGMQVQGTQIWFGRIAALGSHSSGGGVLQAAPGNSFRIAPTEQSLSKDAKTWAERSGNYLVPTLLFDPLQKKRSQPKEKTWSQTVEEGGPIGVLILVLAGLGVLLLVERGVTLLWMTNWRRAQWSLLLQQARDKHWSAARALTVGMGANTPVLKSIMENPDSSREDMQEVASESILRVLPTFQRSFTLLNVIITVAPLLGLLGTVTGMIATFEVITQFGTGNPKLLSQGISEALITTKLGLAVAVPLLLAKSVLSRWADRVLEALQLRAMILINQIHQPNSQPQSTSDTTEQQGQDGAV